MTTSQLIHTLRRFITISRPVWYIPTLATFIVGLLASQGTLLSIGSFVGALFATFPMGLIVYGTNDLADQESDAQNPRRGGIDGARLKKSESRPLAWTIIITAASWLFICALFRDVGLGLAILGICAFAYTYSLRPIRLKTRPGLDSLSNGFWVVSLFMAGYWANVQGFSLQLPSAKILIAIAMFSAAFHALGSTMDYEADKAAGDTTICVALGKAKTLLLCALVFLVCLLLIHGQSLAIDIYLIVGVGLTISTLRNQSTRYIRAVFYTIPSLLPFAFAAKYFLE